MSDEEITPARAGALLAAAVQGVAWALIENETDTADRGVSEEHYRDAVQRAQNILPTLLPGVVAEEPEWEYDNRRNGNQWYSTEQMESSTRRRRKAGPWLPVEN